MEKYFAEIKKSPLFAGMSDTEINSSLRCLNAKARAVSKGSFVFATGDRPDIGILLSGTIHIVQEDYWGNRTILSVVTEGGLFAEAFSLAGKAMPVYVLAAEKCEVLIINSKRLTSDRSESCVHHIGLVHNLLKIISQKNITLTQKIEHITKKTTREKVLSYLSECAAKEGSNSFDIPFNRQELAEYLSVERSALSAELSKMRDGGLLDFKKSRFTLYES